jgi:steroid delta-isomerase-like uncharacterized protein
MGVGKDLWNELMTLRNNHDVGAAASLYASDAVLIDPTVLYEGRDAIRGCFEALFRPFDHKIETSMLVEEGDTVAAESLWRGTNTGPIAMPYGTEIAATGKTVELRGVAVLTIRDGKIASERAYVDMAAMATQLA